MSFNRIVSLLHNFSNKLHNKHNNKHNIINIACFITFPIIMYTGYSNLFIHQRGSICIYDKKNPPPTDQLDPRFRQELEEAKILNKNQ